MHFASITCRSIDKFEYKAYDLFVPDATGLRASNSEWYWVDMKYLPTGDIQADGFLHNDYTIRLIGELYNKWPTFEDMLREVFDDLELCSKLFAAAYLGDRNEAFDDLRDTVTYSQLRYAWESLKPLRYDMVSPSLADIALRILRYTYPSLTAKYMLLVLIRNGETNILGRVFNETDIRLDRIEAERLVKESDDVGTLKGLLCLLPDLFEKQPELIEFAMSRSFGYLMVALRSGGNGWLRPRNQRILIDAARKTGTVHLEETLPYIDFKQCSEGRKREIFRHILALPVRWIRKKYVPNDASGFSLDTCHIARMSSDTLDLLLDRGAELRTVFPKDLYCATKSSAELRKFKHAIKKGLRVYETDNWENEKSRLLEAGYSKNDIQLLEKRFEQAPAYLGRSN